MGDTLRAVDRAAKRFRALHKRLRARAVKARYHESDERVAEVRTIDRCAEVLEVLAEELRRKA